jgi:putative transposase
MPDHVHLLVSLHRVSIARTVQLVKANSSKWVHGTFSERRKFAWQAGYGAFSVSYSNLPQVKNYIAHQAEHHHHQTFQDEFREFLGKHEISWDEKYVWD